MDGETSLQLEIFPTIAEIGQEAWDGCAGEDNPFISYAFLSSLEESGSVGGRSGWHPRHLALRDAAGGLQAVAPAYAKTHSYGEYVFDQGWANAFERAGGRYYPKLQVASPFSPVPGPRLLGATPEVMAAALEATCNATKTSSAHVTFCTEAEWEGLGRAGWLQRLGMQFHWENPGYESFEDFLAALSSRKRKAIRRERRDAQAGLTFRALRGLELTPAIWAIFYEFYLSTVERKWGGAYLTPEFFPLLGKRLGERVVLMLAERNGKPIAGALNLRGDGVLYGRNWGALEDVPFLHFELCYYQAIDYAIAHGLKRVEAGAQGQHKIQRGYLPKPTYSAHYIEHPGLRAAVAEFVAAEREEMLSAMEAMAAEGPYRRDGEG
ncbi:GNAT family N-acetyltransferase [Acidocella facilis]|uniref:GNAT family N-acetyltransferase n=1 Tax=Acidocella facilis TaxID=525 RepID=UPI001F371975|nr:GNAT family N-acetyltransferase [Acidocella facilis]